MKRFLRYAAIFVGVVLVLIQFIPVQHDNPTTTRAVKWNAPETRALAQRACFDCHSNESVWPWYSYVAPVSLRVASHVHEGRDRLNFSAWDQPNASFEEMKKVISQGEMPLSDYLLLHGAAKLTTVEKQQLIDGLQATLANDPPIARPRRSQP